MFKKLSIIAVIYLLWSLVFCYGIVHGADITLSWDAPTTNVDGTPLTDLAGYKIYHGIVSGVYDSPTDVHNVTTITLQNFCEGTHYFVATAYDTSGNESGYSNEVNKVIKIAPTNPSSLRIP